MPLLRWLFVLPVAFSWTPFAPLVSRRDPLPVQSFSATRKQTVPWVSSSVSSTSGPSGLGVRQAELQPLPAVVRESVQLPSGLKMELVSALAPPSALTKAKKDEPVEEIMAMVSNLLPWLQPDGAKGPAAAIGKKTAVKGKKPPLVFIHGSFHSSWCWAEHFLPYFASRGWDSYALSLRGTSKSPDPNGVKTIKISTYADDVLALLDARFGGDGAVKPVIIGHSFGGSVLMKLLEKSASVVQGAAFLCSVPPSGNQDMTARFLKRDFVLALKIVVGFVLKKAVDWPWLCRELFFDADLGEEQVEAYMTKLKADSVAGIDVKDFLSELPSIKAQDGKAPWLASVDHRFVLGAKADAIVDLQGVEETAEFVGTTAVVVPKSHDVMLGNKWELAATQLEQWLSTIPSN